MSDKPISDLRRRMLEDTLLRVRRLSVRVYRADDRQVNEIVPTR